MTNFEYIMKNIKPIDLAIFLGENWLWTCENENSILTRARNAYINSDFCCNETAIANRTDTVKFQLWLAQQYNGKIWE